MFMLDPLYMMLILPAFALVMYAQYKVKATYARYNKIRASSGLTGADVARRLLASNGLSNVSVEQVRGQLTDHYDPRGKVLRLSEGVYGSSSIAAISVAAHETGHALQDKVEYLPMAIRHNLVPVANLGSQMGFPLFFLGLIFRAGSLMELGIIIFSLAIAFHVVTLPVELNASSRALQLLTSEGILVERSEVAAGRKVLNAAALTYIATLAMAVMQLLYMIMRSRD